MLCHTSNYHIRDNHPWLKFSRCKITWDTVNWAQWYIVPFWVILQFRKKSKQRNIWNILSQICWIIVCLTIFNVLLTWALLSKKSRVKDKTFVLFNVLWCNRCTFDRLDICFASYKSMSTYLTTIGGLKWFVGS